jgi:toxin-antitoxin system PIN domain toxin
MSAAVDVNVLLYASDESSRHHQRARSLLAELAAGPTLLSLFWPVVMGYLRMATHPSVFDRPLAFNDAAANINMLRSRPELVATEVPSRGNQVPDAHLVAPMHQHGVHTIWSHDRDFRKYTGIQVNDPFA